MMRAQEMRVAIYGAGAMGTVLGVLLQKGGQNVDLITRNETHVYGMRECGATVVCEAEGIEIMEKVNALFPHEMTGKYDVIFLMTKQRHNEEILKSLLPYLQEDGVICTTQNGLPEKSVAKIVGKNRTYGAATSYGATFLGGGRVALTSKFQGMRMEVGGYENDGVKTDLLVKILSHVGKAIGNEAFVKPTENLLGSRWAKLSINAAFSGLSVITGKTFGEIAKDKKTRLLALKILRECIKVAKASHITLPKTQGYNMEKWLGGETPIKRLVAYLVLPFAMRKHKKLLSGMLKDVQNHKTCEIDFINGVVVEEGRKVGISTPYCQKVIEITKGIEAGIYQIDYKNVERFD